MALGPIVGDFDGMAASLCRLFDLRHILCHELPTEPIYESREVGEFLNAAIRFTRAVEEVLTLERFGLVPLTQTDMNIAAGELLRGAEETLSGILSGIQARLGADDDWLHCLAEAQRAWLLYRNAQCEFETYRSRGGTIRPMIWGSEATRLTSVRAEELQAWLEQNLRK
jgi:uncharacterized protein YecT (DUF1311 family)